MTINRGRAFKVYPFLVANGGPTPRSRALKS
jgi:hypothetical protein